VGHQPALYFVPNLGKARVEFLSDLLFFHEHSPIDDYTPHDTPRGGGKLEAGAKMGQPKRPVM
jgi:hypothetical protein